MLLQLPEFQALRTLTSDGRLLFCTRIVRLFAYGFLSVVLVLYLAQIGLSNQEIGWLLTWTLVGDAIISLGIASVADRVGRRAGWVDTPLSVAVDQVVYARAMSSQRAEAELDHQARGLETTIRDSLEWFRGNGYLG